MSQSVVLHYCDVHNMFWMDAAVNQKDYVDWIYSCSFTHGQINVWTLLLCWLLTHHTYRTSWHWIEGLHGHFHPAGCSVLCCCRVTAAATVFARTTSSCSYESTRIFFFSQINSPLMIVSVLPEFCVTFCSVFHAAVLYCLKSNPPKLQYSMLLTQIISERNDEMVAETVSWMTLKLLKKQQHKTTSNKVHSGDVLELLIVLWLQNGTCSETVLSTTVSKIKKEFSIKLKYILFLFICDNFVYFICLFVFYKNKISSWCSIAKNRHSQHL